MTKRQTRNECYKAYKILRDKNKKPEDKITEIYGIIFEIEKINKTNHS